MKRYAFLLDYLYVATFQQEAVEGLAAALPGAGAELYVFIGGPFRKDLYDPFVESRNSVYGMISRDLFDGIIVSNTVGNFIPPGEVCEYLRRFGDIPVVFYGGGPDSYHRVAVDNRTGMEQVLRHLLVDHGYRRIGFIKGPPDNQEAVERYDVYRRELAAAGLPFDEDLVVEGDFNIGKGMEAVRVLFDDRRVRCEALVASNDFMALGAKLELERRGLSIPRDIALTGFDDTRDAASVIPGLTTVRQPYAALGQAAYETLSGLADGRETPALRALPAELVIRQSCGCFNQGGDGGQLDYAQASDRPPEEFYAASRSRIIEGVRVLLAPYGFSDRTQDIEGFSDAVFRNLAGAAGQTAFILLQKLITFGVANRVNVDIWQDLLSLLRRAFSPLFRDRDGIERSEKFFHRARLLVGGVQDIQKNQNLLFGWKQTDQLAEISRFLFGAVESSDLVEVVYRTFRYFDIENFLFAEYLPGPGPDRQARVVALIEEGEPRREMSGTVYPARDIFPAPGHGFGARVYFVLPVTYQEKALGFVVYEQIEDHLPHHAAAPGELARGFYYEKMKGLQPFYVSLTRELANSFYIHELILLRKATEESLTTLTTDLEFRNRELEEFIHIISHDLKEPLRKIAVFGDRLKASLTSGAGVGSLEDLGRMQRAATRMRQLFDRLLDYSRVATRRPVSAPVDSGAVAALAAQDLETMLRETNGRIEMGDLPVVLADGGQMRELFQNLIENALNYRRENVAPIVRIDAARVGGFHEITVADNGLGFDPKYGEKIFGMFQRLGGIQEKDGAGLGLTICKKIVEQHGGSIRAFGEPGRGVRIVIRLRTVPVAGQA